MKGCEANMNRNIEKIRNMLDNVIRAANVFLTQELLNPAEGKDLLRCLIGIRGRFYSADYLSKSPKGDDVDELDKMILPLEQKLLEAGKKKYQTTILYTLKAIVYGLGVGHKIFSEEEAEQEILTMMRRSRKLQEYLDTVEEAEKLDAKLAKRNSVQRQQRNLRDDIETCEQRVQHIKTVRPDIMDEIRYYGNPDKMSSEAREYVQLHAVLGKLKTRVIEAEDELNNTEVLLEAYQQTLQEAGDFIKSFDAEGNSPQEAEIFAELSRNAEVSEDEETEEFFVEDGEISEETMLKMQKIIQKFIDADAPDVVDLRYEQMERVFSSEAMNRYAASSLKDFEEHGLQKDSEGAEE